MLKDRSLKAQSCLYIKWVTLNCQCVIKTVICSIALHPGDFPRYRFINTLSTYWEKKKMKKEDKEKKKEEKGTEDKREEEAGEEEKERLREGEKGEGRRK